jgi:hypothetical protein
MSCGCNSEDSYEVVNSYRKKKDKIGGKWIMDIQSRKLYAEKPIYDVYGDIVGYITKNESGDTIRIFSKNIVKILE